MRGNVKDTVSKLVKEREKEISKVLAQLRLQFSALFDAFKFHCDNITFSLNCLQLHSQFHNTRK